MRVAAQGRAGRERLLRYCVHPILAGERPVWAGGGAQEHRLGQQRSIELRLSASDFLDRIEALIPPPRTHRHRYFWGLAPNLPWWAMVPAQAGRKLATERQVRRDRRAICAGK